MKDTKEPRKPTIMFVKDTDAVIMIGSANGKPTVTMGPMPKAGAPKGR